MEGFHSLCLPCGVVAHYLWQGEKQPSLLNYAFVLFLFSAPGSHTQWTIVHHFSHICEMRAVGDLSHAVDDCPSFLSQL